MLTEIAVTPQILGIAQNDTKGVWREDIRELSREMFPPNKLNPVIVSDLCDGHWFEEAVKAVKGIVDQKARYLAQSLLQKLDSVHVPRPRMLGAPCDEDSWVYEVNASSKEELIGGIVATEGAFRRLGGTSKALLNLKGIGHNEFWKNVAPSLDCHDLPGLCRWGVSFTHVARERGGDHPATWSLLAEKAIDDWKRKFYGTSSPVKGPITISTR